jgi:hypothetical protein
MIHIDVKKMVHLITTDDVQCALGDVGIYVEALRADFLPQLTDQNLAIL